jgi:hypothetical protein
MRRASSFIFLVCILSTALSLTSYVYAAGGKPITNTDITKMIRAGLSDDIIVKAIQAEPSKLDTSPEALIELKKAGASTKILDAVIGSENGNNQAAMNRQEHNSPDFHSFSSFNRVIYLDHGVAKEMKSSSPSIFSKPGFFRNSSWYVFQGTHADLRVNTSKPTFEVNLPSQNKPDNLVNIVKPEVTDSERRIEIATAGLFVSSKTLAKQNVPVKMNEVKDRTGPGGAFSTYKVIPEEPLPPGEYVLQALGRYFEFGVDPEK